ncbi:S41 family peptidase [Amycolatopsis pigmentata]|uniref:S41 family peptidase n=1 Tax=Amycolatopsis pigmentata TaxID=450801 RepID=A0ABW5FWW1_9PSEU
MLTHQDPPVALLTSGVTASAAEAVLVAFRGLNRARTFGRPTAGFATGNTIFPLSDGAVLVVTEVRDEDRTGTLYGNVPIPPDQPLPEDATAGETVAAAQAWLHAQPGCRAS